MFSLIITIISIALVAALALATLYYGGSSWTRGNAASNAATVTNQGQQIRGAMELYYADHSAYPASLQDLVTGDYLKTIPVPPAMLAFETGLVTPALAAGDTWTLLAGGQPAFMVQDVVPKDVCQELNYLNLGSDAIREKIDPTKAYQCFGPAAGPFTFISGVPGPGDALASLKQAVTEYNTAHDPDLPVVTDADPANAVTVAETRSKTAVAGGGNEPPPAQAPSAAFLLGSYPNVLWSSGELLVSETCWGVSWDPNRPLLSGANFLGATSTIAGNAFSYGADYATYEPNGDVYMDPLVAAAHGWNLYAPDYNSGGFDFGAVRVC